MQSIIYFLSFCILTWIECLIFSLVFVVIGMYNLILLTSSICLVDRYEETPVLQKSIWINNPQILQCSRLYYVYLKSCKYSRLYHQSNKFEKNTLNILLFMSDILETESNAVITVKKTFNQLVKFYGF